MDFFSFGDTKASLEKEQGACASLPDRINEWNSKNPSNRVMQGQNMQRGNMQGQGMQRGNEWNVNRDEYRNESLMDGAGGRRRRRSHKLMGGRKSRRGKRSGSKQTGGRKRKGRRTRR